MVKAGADDKATVIEQSVELDQKDTVTFSVRLTEAQRALITKAAEVRGWTPTNLLRVAALEKAAHIANTSTPRSIDFKGVASTIANQVFARRICRVLDPHAEAFVEADVFESFDDVPNIGDYVNPVEVSPWQMPPTFLELVKDAARFGGTEFLGLILQAAEDITSRVRPDLPPPVDPSSI